MDQNQIYLVLNIVSKSQNVVVKLLALGIGRQQKWSNFTNK